MSARDENRGRRRPSRDYQSGGAPPPLPSSSQPPLQKVARPREDESPRRAEKYVKRERDDGIGERPSSSSRSSSAAPSKPLAPRQSGGSERGPPSDGRRTRVKYEIVKTRPADVVDKRGRDGRPIQLQANYFKLDTTPSWRIYQYHVDIVPDVELRGLRRFLLAVHRDRFGGFLFDGTKMFTATKLEEEKTVLQSQSKSGDQYTVTLTMVGVVSMTEHESLQVLNLILRRATEGLKLQQVGRDFYDAKAKIELREFRLQLWPGYTTSIRQHEDSIMVCVDVAHKVMRTETVYDILRQCAQGGGDYQESFRRSVIGMTVLTDYNNKTYRITEVDFSLNPKMTFACKDKEMCYMDYYYQKYNIRIRDAGQPLLVSIGQERMRENQLILLIPELCRATGLTDNMRSDFRLMRALGDHTRMNPDRRLERLRTYNNRLQNAPECAQLLKSWNMTLDDRVATLKGRILPPQSIYFGNQKQVSAGMKADWSQAFRDSGMFMGSERGLDRWAVIAFNRDDRAMRNFVSSMIRAGRGMSMRIANPQEYILPDDRAHTFMDAFQQAARRDPQLLLVLIPNNNADRYASIKKLGCIENSVPTQVITRKTASNERGLMSIATKVAIQIHCKLGYAPWMVKTPPGLMVVGYNTAKSARDRTKAFGALVASMDLQTNATFYSTVAESSAYDLSTNNLWPMMVKALQQYKQEHGQLPPRIILYRDGVSDGSLQYLCEHEVKEVVAKLQEQYQRATNKLPLFAYVLVNKSINTRFFDNGRNPPVGTVVDDVVTCPESYDFFLVSQSVRQGTVAPTRYNVLYSNIGYSPDQMQTITYKMTHLYYNWPGTLRVPAVCQYANKLATLIGTAVHQLPRPGLEKKLYYL